MASTRRAWSVSRGLGLLATAAVVLAASLLWPAAAADEVGTDKKRDAFRTLDITRVEVSHTNTAVKVVVRIRDFKAMDSGAKVPTALGIHFDTKGTRKPNHLIKIDGMHTAAGSTRDWNRFRPNGMDPWGDWTDCFPAGWDKPLIRPKPKKDKLAFLAPRSCLGDPKRTRVSVQSYRPWRTKVTGDWAPSARKYLPWVTLD